MASYLTTRMRWQISESEDMMMMRLCLSAYDDVSVYEEAYLLCMIIFVVIYRDDEESVN